MTGKRDAINAQRSCNVAVYNVGKKNSRVLNAPATRQITLVSSIPEVETQIETKSGHERKAEECLGDDGARADMGWGKLKTTPRRKEDSD
ncbi:unnamed protein product [Lasius platythorax]|uniref:Uncharacterized protein n=1 Tax=Lasius platythorax TaxID=488582 RepID=A0AAV2PDH9_9HYME